MHNAHEHGLTRNPRFRKRTQEDSHEVLRCLLTEMKNEELEVCR